MTIQSKFPLRASLACSLVLGLSACIGGTADNRSLNSVHQPIVERSNFTIDLNLSGSNIPVRERGRLSGWFDAMGLGYGDRVSIDDPGNNRAARDTITAIVARHGIIMSQTAPVTTGTIQPGTLRVVVSRSSAHVPGCPDWSAKSETNFNNATSPNFGCASNSNLAAMVADAEDLVRGQGDGTSDSQTASKAIRTLRDSEPTGSGGLQGGGTAGGAGGTGGGGQ